MKHTRSVLICSAAALSLAGAGALAAFSPINLQALNSALPGEIMLAGSSAAPASVPAEPKPKLSESSDWLSMFPPAKPAEEAFVEAAPLLPSIMLQSDAPVMDIRLPVVIQPEPSRLAVAATDNLVPDPQFSTISSVPLQFAKNSENVEIGTAALPQVPEIAAMDHTAVAPVHAAEEIEMPAEQLQAPVPMTPPVVVEAAVADEFNPFGNFGLVSDPVSALVDSYASEREALETASLEVEDAEYVAPFAKPEIDPAAQLTDSNGKIDLSVLAGMSPEQIQASIALVAALQNPDQAQNYLDRIQGAPAPAPEPVRQLPPVQFSGIPGLNDELELPVQNAAPEAAEETGNLLTRGWEAIDNYGVVSLRKDGDTSTDLVVEEGMILGALGPVVSVRRTNTSLIVETAKAGEILGLPDFRPRPRPAWRDSLN